MKIIQNTKEWLEAKIKTIGGSEIFSLVLHYCKKELAELNANFDIDITKEDSFKSALEIWLKFKGATQPELPKELGEFGLSIEEYAAYKARNSTKALIRTSKDFINESDFHPLASCSPDGFVLMKKDDYVMDFDQKNLIDRGFGLGILELKITNHFMDLSEGAKWQYIFQTQYNMAVAGLDWCLLSVLKPIDREFDTPYEKGKTVGYAECENYAELDKRYDIFNFFAAKNPVIQKLCQLALDRFQGALDDNVAPSISEGKKAVLVRERKALESLNPERFGELNVSETEADQDLNNLKLLQTERDKIQAEEEEIKTRLTQVIGNRTSLRGSDFIYTYDKRGYSRLKKI